MLTTWIGPSDILDLQANVHKQSAKDPIFSRNRTLPKLCTSTFSRNGSFPKLCLSGQQRHSLQPEAQATWDLLSDEAKAIILGLHKDPRKCTVNLHNISAFDFLQANMHELQLDDIEDTDNTPPDPDDDHGEAGAQVDEDNSTAHFLTKQQGSTHPGHLANVLSTSKTKHAKGTKFMDKPNACPPPPSKDDEIVVNGKRYCQVKVHHIFYSVSSHKFQSWLTCW